VTIQLIQLIQPIQLIQLIQLKSNCSALIPSPSGRVRRSLTAKEGEGQG